MAFCQKCGAELSEGAAFCPKCGAPQNAPQGASQDAAQNAAAGEEQRTKQSVNAAGAADKVKDAFAKLPFTKLAEKYSTKAPFLAKVAPFANYAVCALVLLLVIIMIGGRDPSSKYVKAYKSYTAKVKNVKTVDDFKNVQKEARELSDTIKKLSKEGKKLSPKSIEKISKAADAYTQAVNVMNAELKKNGGKIPTAAERKAAEKAAAEAAKLEAQAKANAEKAEKAAKEALEKARAELADYQYLVDYAYNMAVTKESGTYTFSKDKALKVSYWEDEVTETDAEKAVGYINRGKTNLKITGSINSNQIHQISEAAEAKGTFIRLDLSEAKLEAIGEDYLGLYYRYDGDFYIGRTKRGGSNSIIAVKTPAQSDVEVYFARNVLFWEGEKKFSDRYRDELSGYGYRGYWPYVFFPPENVQIFKKAVNVYDNIEIYDSTTDLYFYNETDVPTKCAERKMKNIKTIYCPASLVKQYEDFYFSRTTAEIKPLPQEHATFESWMRNDSVLSREDFNRLYPAAVELAKERFLEKKQQDNNHYKLEGEVSATSRGSSDWKKFLDDYADFVDEYIDVMADIKDDPSDFTAIAKSADLATWAAALAEQADKIKGDLTGDDLAEFTKRYMEILGKLNSIM